jgi:RHS repeat-associated protein
MKPMKNKILLVAAVAFFVALNVQAWYDPSTGRWFSRDPIQQGQGFEQTDPTPDQDLVRDEPNVYSFVKNDSVNAVDLFGEKRFTIWAAAFIAKKHIHFPYAYTTPWPGVDPSAQWGGDGRGFGVVRGSSRAWNYIEIETDLAQKPEVVNVSGSGMSQVTYSIGFGLEFTDYGLAPDPAKATITRSGSGTVVKINVESHNPLVPFSPPIKYTYIINFNECSHKIDYFGSHTRYPWQELWISGFNDVVKDPPSGPTKTPADLYEPVVPVGGEVSY